jgi:NADH-quinone oxidoreductase subunit M
MSGLPILSILIFLPIVAGVLCLFLPGKSDDPSAARWLGLGASLVTLLLALLALIGFAPGTTGLVLEERVTWIPQFGVSYHLGADGLNILLIALTAILTPPAIIASWNVLGERPRLFIGLILLLEGSIIGALSSLDLILYFVFWEAMLIPMYLLISTFGGARRGYAALKFFIYTSVGSLLMLLAMLYLSYAHTTRVASATPSFDLADLIGTQLSATEGRWLFLAFALAFAIKLPLFPLHSWLPDAYSQSPVTVLVLSTMLVKVGAYSFLRFVIPLFPQAASELMPYLAILATIGIIYGGLVALAQRDMIRLLAYSSLAHLGFVGLGIFALDSRSAEGSLLQMVNHGVSSGALFLIAGMIIARVGTADIDALGGLARRWPLLSGVFVLAAFSSLGLPGLNGFVGEFLILLGTFRTQPILASVATFGVLIAALYILRLFRRTMFGRERSPEESRRDLVSGDLSLREIAALAPLLLLIVWIGVYPGPFLRRTEGAVRSTISAVGVPAPAANALTTGATALTSVETIESR